MPSSSLDPVQFENRFGLGTMPRSSPARWLRQPDLGYVAVPPVLAGLPGRSDASAALAAFQDARRDRRLARSEVLPEAMPGTSPPQMSAMPDSEKAAYRDARQDIVAMYRQQVAARYTAAVNAENSFAERLVHFWSNHFAVSADNVPMTVFAGLQEQEAIRPHIFGSFADMLMAVEHHPAILTYLNQSTSIGPTSPAAQRRANNGGKLRGLNENLGREILELHTLGVQGGYKQHDVTELARALTGFTISGYNAGPRAGSPGDFRFAAQQHEPGERTILGKTYAAGGEIQANAVLADLAVHPATARHLSFKLARHFVADEPSPALVERLARKFVAGKGDLKGWYGELIAAPEVAAVPLAKYKTPWEWVVSSGRVMGLAQFPRPQVLVTVLNQLGQPVWKPKSPAGYDDIAASWLASDALMRRVEAVPRMIALVPELPDARTIAPKVLGSMLRPTTIEALARAEDNKQAMALLLLSPEFLRR